MKTNFGILARLLEESPRQNLDSRDIAANLQYGFVLLGVLDVKLEDR